MSEMGNSCKGLHLMLFWEIDLHALLPIVNQHFGHCQYWSLLSIHSILLIDCEGCPNGFSPWILLYIFTLLQLPVCTVQLAYIVVRPSSEQWDYPTHQLCQLLFTFAEKAENRPSTWRRQLIFEDIVVIVNRYCILSSNCTKTNSFLCLC